ncbi:hypothetical protein [Morganella morganii]|uniref:hypothetical protein n=1 Tax=Morganella morganii TaxID=582 RepID=UPI00236866D5|nr:hypothetical protein [Morganella morganii]
MPRLPDKKWFLRESGDTATTAPIPSIVSDITGSDCLTTGFAADDSATETGKIKGKENSRYNLIFFILNVLYDININMSRLRILRVNDDKIIYQ